MFSALSSYSILHSVIRIPGLFRFPSRLRGAVLFFSPRHPQGEAIGLHPIQRKAPCKVAGNLVGNGATSLSSLPDHISFHPAPESRISLQRLRRFAAGRALELLICIVTAPAR